jgi:UDP-2-acetamido-3-amino-2,3-dideoxy-glucuronate N-acetyltransferase
MIGAGAVVKTDVPAHAIITGVPGRQTGWVCRCGTTLKFHQHEAQCQYCGNNYRLDNNMLITVKQEKLFE